MYKIDAPAQLIEQVYHAILDAICTGALAPNAKITQEGLAEQLGVSRQPILQAFQILKREGYISDFRTEDARVGKSLIVQLKYGPNRERSLAGLRRVSKPGLRVYAKSTNLPRVLGGLGVAIISTSSGLLTDRQAARSGVGGEVLAYVW